MLSFLSFVLKLGVWAIFLCMVYMAFYYWYSRNSSSKLAVMLRTKLFFVPDSFWPQVKADEGPTLRETVEKIEEELDPEKQLLNAEKGFVFRHLFVSQVVEARVSSLRMEQRVQRQGEPWFEVRGYERNQLVFVDGKQLFAFYPFGERALPQWYVLDPHDASGLWQEFTRKGGAGREFGNSGQRADVRFTYGGTEWRVKDIGQNSAILESGTSRYFGSNGRFAHLIAEEVGGDRVFLFMHIEDGSGYDSAWIGQKADTLDIEVA